MVMNERQTLTIPKEKVERRSILKRRVYAFTLDLTLIFLVNKALHLSFMSFVDTYFFHFTNQIKADISFNLLSIQFLTLTLVFNGYFFLSYYLNKGQSPGKIAFNLRVLPNHSTSEELSARECVTRTMSYFICWFVGFWPFALSFIRKDSKGLPDFLSSSHVCSIEELEMLASLEDTGVSTTNKGLFPEDPVSIRFSRKVS